MNYYITYLLIYYLYRLVDTTSKEILDTFLLITNVINIILFFVPILYTRLGDI